MLDSASSSSLASAARATRAQGHGGLAALKEEGALPRSRVSRNVRSAFLERSVAETNGRLQLRSMAYRRPGYAAGLLRLLTDGKQVLDDT